VLTVLLITVTIKAVVETVNRSLTPKRGSEATALRIVMLQRGLDYRALAKLAKLDRRVVANVLSGNNHCWPPRAALNRALQEKIFVKPSKKLGKVRL